jgi:hypothetical protein
MVALRMRVAIHDAEREAKAADSVCNRVVHFLQ